MSNKTKWGLGDKKVKVGDDLRVRYSSENCMTDDLPVTSDHIADRLNSPDAWCSLTPIMNKNLGTGSYGVVLTTDNWPWCLRISEIPKAEGDEHKEIMRARPQLSLKLTEITTLMMANWGLGMGENVSCVLPKVAAQALLLGEKIHACIVEKLKPLEKCLEPDNSLRSPTVFATSIVRFLACYSHLFMETQLSHWDLYVSNVMVREHVEAMRLPLRINTIPVTMDVVLDAGPGLVMIDLDSCLQRDSNTQRVLFPLELSSPDYYHPFSSATGTVSCMLIKMFIDDCSVARSLWRFKGNRVARPLVAIMVSVFCEWFPEGAEGFLLALKELERGRQEVYMKRVIDSMACGLAAMNLHMYFVHYSELVSVEDAVKYEYVKWSLLEGVTDVGPKHTLTNFYKVWLYELAGLKVANIRFKCAFFFDYPSHQFAEQASNIDHYNLRVLAVARRLGLRVEACVPQMRSALALSEDEASSTASM